MVRGQNPVTPRSACPHCHENIAWHDNIPVLSWILLCGKCRSCSKPISVLYPIVELLTALVFTLLWLYIPHVYFFSYAFFFSALIVSIRSDIETMLISRFVTLFLVPVGFFLSALGFLPITMIQSILGALAGYFSLYLFAKLFEWFTGKKGMGQGDLDLLAFIGSFIGPLGCWFVITIGSIIGSIWGISSILFLKKSKSTKIPFGPFLALGAISYVFLQDTVLQWLLS
ncbi:prepilin peptidase [Candidatus Dependentiae bacterium]|nr:prepilin peptidase [Candidatus Dependentiae bacterium]